MWSVWIFAQAAFHTMGTNSSLTIVKVAFGPVTARQGPGFHVGDGTAVSGTGSWPSSTSDGSSYCEYVCDLMNSSSLAYPSCGRTLLVATYGGLSVIMGTYSAAVVASMRRTSSVGSASGPLS